jgi:anti-sigma regulatory factor (Ser/Thr protein kinase)
VTAAQVAEPVLDQRFDRATLPVVRAAARTAAIRSGLPRRRADDVTLVLHELAANAVRHGAGRGRLRVWDSAGELRCRIDDGHPRDGQSADPGWPVQPGHGLWIARQVADRMWVTSGPAGTRAEAVFQVRPIRLASRSNASRMPRLSSAVAASAEGPSRPSATATCICSSEPGGWSVTRSQPQ